MIKTLNKILKIFFPYHCLNCQKILENNQLLCFNCLNQIKINSAFFCPQCQKKLTTPFLSCHKQSKYLLAALSFYESPLKELIHHLKYYSFKNSELIIKLIINQYLEKILKNYGEFLRDEYWLLHVPLHPKKLKKRGYNQSLILAQILKEELKLFFPKLKTEIKEDIVIRIKNTIPQSRLKTVEEKYQNLENAFFLDSKDFVKNKNFIIVDDISTSGATLKEITKILKANGAKKIIGFVLLKA